jgi:hypothetical protein
MSRLNAHVSVDLDVVRFTSDRITTSAPKEISWASLITVLVYENVSLTGSYVVVVGICKVWKEIFSKIVDCEQEYQLIKHQDHNLDDHWPAN